MKKIICALLVVLCLTGVAYPAKKAAKKAPKSTVKKAERWLTTEEVEEILRKEETPMRELFTKISESQQKVIAAECKASDTQDIKRAEKVANSAVNYDADPMKWLSYHDMVYANFALESRRKIAKKYGIQAGDTYTLEVAEIQAGLRTEVLSK